MATQTIERSRVLADGRDAARSRSGASPLELVLAPLASLKLTVILFALSIVLVFTSTLAQHRKGIWQVIDQYYSTPVAHIDFQDLLPPSFFPSNPKVSGGFIFPGGALIGALMALNLLAAHARRFRVRAGGPELAVGLAIIAVGALATWLVIASGSNQDGFQHAASIDWSTLWKLMKIGVGALFLASLYGTIYAVSRTQTPYWWRGLCVCGTLGLGALFVFVLRTGPLNDSAMRILWQLTKAELAALVLLAGCIPVFKKRAGVVVLHAGVGLMLTQLFVGIGVLESQMRIEEGETVNFTQDIRAIELAITDRAPESAYETAYIPDWVERQDRPLAEKADNIVTVPGTMLTAAEERISDERLPFDVEVVLFMQNSVVDEIPPGGQRAPATAGAGLRYNAQPALPTTGTDDKVDMAAAYLRFFEKGSSNSLGTYLVSQWLKPQTIEAGGKTYELDLRFKRLYKPYAITLKDIQKQDYLGTDTPRDYSSFVHLRDPGRSVDREVRIWMNNPLRYAGETFYQSGYHRDMETFTDPATGLERPVLVADPATGQRQPKYVETTTLSVVANTGWMIPYVSCMIVFTGMLAHFVLILVRFLSRRAVEEHIAQARAADSERMQPESPQVKAARRAVRTHGGVRKVERTESQEPPAADDSWLGGGWRTIAAWVLPALLVLLAAGYALGKLFPSDPPKGHMALREFGKIPVVDGGRAKPIDSLARNSLQKISGRETFVGRMDFPRLKDRWSAIKDKLAGKWDGLSESDFRKFDEQLADKASGNPHAFAADLTAMIVERTGEDRREVAGFVDSLTTEKQPALRWLLDVIAKPQEGFEHPVIRIENLDVLSSLGLERRKGFRYAIAEFREHLGKVGQQADQARELRRKSGTGALDSYQRKILELEGKVGVVYVLAQSFLIPDIRTDHALDDLRAAVAEQQRLAEQHPPLTVPPEGEDEEWQTYSMAWMKAWVQTHAAGQKPDPVFDQMSHMIHAYATGDAEKFKASIDGYWTALKAHKPAELDLTKVGWEAWYNQFAPLFSSIWLYLAAFVIAALGWLGWSKPLNRSALWLILFAFVIHSIGLYFRIYISGRPPVTNLYSSAVFIAWGAVVLGLVVEMIYRNGIGNVIAAKSGFATLLIAWSLSKDGDTFTVLQAVLDTQFWLATHVTCITLGYATTFVAGLIGLLYVLRGSRPAPLVVGLGLIGLAWHFFSGSTWEYATQAGIFSVLAAISCLGMGGLTLAGVVEPEFPAEERRSMTRMIYGTLCFSIFFSFIGTVLGGLWADDSWGRFWGWDPKENGAMIIVLWNALVLHARWDGWVKDRGLAVLAIGGNIVTGWSWFGVNELGVGLHSYGFTDGVLMTLGLFILSQLAVMALGCLPKAMWWHDRGTERATA